MYSPHSKILLYLLPIVVTIGYMGYIYRPISMTTWSDIASYQLSYQLWWGNDISISIYGSWQASYHSQAWEIHDHSYNRLRTWYIDTFSSGWNIAIDIKQRQANNKKWWSTHQLIDMLAERYNNTAIQIFSWASSWYITNNRPWIEIQKSYNNTVSLHMYIYCHRRWRTTKNYICSVSSRLSYPWWYRPIDGSLAIDTTSTGIMTATRDRSQTLSIPQLLAEIK